MSKDEILQAKFKRIISSFKDAGLELKDDPEKVGSPAVRLWLYSCQFDPKAGFRLRLASQASADTYRRMKGKDQLKPLINEESDLKHLSPVDALSSVIRAFDHIPMDGEDGEAARQALTLFMCQYACSTKTWALAPGLDEVDGIHIALIDWKLREEVILRPAMVIRKNMLVEEEVAALCAVTLNRHFSLHPEDQP